MQFRNNRILEINYICWLFKICCKYEAYSRGSGGIFSKIILIVYIFMTIYK